jgi:leucyl aminopeptidase (aminopeptidase T)
MAGWDEATTATCKRPAHSGTCPPARATSRQSKRRGNGTIVIDGSLASHGRLADLVHITVRDGRAIDARGDAGRWLMETLTAGGDHGRSIAELGIGTNPAAQLSGNVLEDEKAIGTAHLAFGASQGIGGATTASVHIDGVMLGVRVDLDGEALLDDGYLNLP